MNSLEINLDEFYIRQIAFWLRKAEECETEIAFWEQKRRELREK